MADTPNSSRSTGRASSRARASRLDSIIGRLVYVPSQNDQGVGRLHRTRASIKRLHLRQVTDFKQWCPPAKVDDPWGRDLAPWRLARSQKNWLQKCYPEACIADEDTEALLVDEIAAMRESKPTAPTQALVSVIAIGDITDVRSENRQVRFPAMAVAVGESGHVLRIVGLAKEIRTWTGAEVMITTSKPNFQFSGELCEDSQPITLLAFALHGTHRNPIRWLIMQKVSSTTICEPELTAVTTFTGPLKATARILPTPLSTIRSNQTGGAPHAHFSFKKMVAKKEAPRLAIIDESGNWSVWQLGVRRQVRSLKPVMLMCGNVVTGTLSNLTSAEAPGTGRKSLLWLVIDKVDQEEEEDSDGKLEVRPSKSVTSSHGREPQSLTLLMCTGTSIYLFDTSAQKLEPLTHVILTPGFRQVLDVKPSPVHESQAFILTNTSLLWVKATEATGGKLLLDVIASCYHRKDNDDPGLRIEISPLASLGEQKAIFVCVRSITDARMTVIWFINPEEGMPAQYYRDVVSIQNPSGFACMQMVPAQRQIATEANGKAFLARQNIRFFQFVAVRHDLSVDSALCVWVDELGARITAPNILVLDTSVKATRRIRDRRRITQTVSDAFVIPDRYEGGRAHEELEGGGGAQTSPPEPPPQKVLNLKLKSSRPQKEDGFIEPANGKGRDLRIDAIGGIFRQGKADGIMPRPPLLDLAGHDRSAEELLQFIEEWESRSVFLDEENGLRTLQPSYRQFGSRMDDLVANLEKIFVEPLTSQNSRGREQRQRRIRHLAAQVFLSEVGITAAEQQRADAGTDVGAEVPFSSSLTFRSSPPLEASQEQPGLPEMGEKEEPVSVRLRQYTLMKPIMTVNPIETAIVSHWELGADTSQIDWNPGRPQTEGEIDLKRKRRMKRARKRAEKLTSRGMSTDLLESTAVAASQPVPVIVASQARETISYGQSSKARGAPPQALGASSQAWGVSSQAWGASLAMSQPVPGTFGARPQKRIKKKSKSGFR